MKWEKEKVETLVKTIKEYQTKLDKLHQDCLDFLKTDFAEDEWRKGLEYGIIKGKLFSLPDLY